MKEIIVCIVFALITLFVLGVSSYATKAPVTSNYLPMCSFNESNDIKCNQ